MTKNLPDIPFSVFLYATLIGHLAYAVPTIASFLLFDLMDIKLVLFAILLYAIVTIPLSAGLVWLIGKGSNWTNAPAALVIACSWPATTYGIFLGGWLGYRLFGTLGSGVGAVLVLIVALIIRIPLGKWITVRFLPTAQLAKH